VEGKIVHALRKTVALALVAGLALMGAPSMAQTYGPNTVWGEVPSGASAAATAVLLDNSGNTIGTAPVVGGKFSFENVQPGQYVVVLTDAASAELARSRVAQMVSGGVVKALFDSTRPVAAATGGGGLGTTGWVLIGAGAVGLGTIIYFATNDDEGAASPSR